jgi:hypothetical protein
MQVMHMFWKSAMKEMERYSLGTINKDAGIIETEVISTYDQRYANDIVADKTFAKPLYKYRITVRISPLESKGVYPKTEVAVSKYIAKVGDLGVTSHIDSKQIDEKVILYRIKRLLEIERFKIDKSRK